MNAYPMQPQTTELHLVAQVASAYFSHNSVQPQQIGEVLASIRKGLSDEIETPAVEVPVPAASTHKTPKQIRDSITPDALICFIDNKPYKMLGLTLRKFGITKEQYREKYGLPYDYPMVAPNYAAERSKLAKRMGLGQRQPVLAPPPKGRAAKANAPKAHANA